MDRLTTMTLNGKSYYLTFSLRSVRNVAEKFGSMSGLSDATAGGDAGASKIDAIVWLVFEMMRAGYRYAKLSGLEAEEPPTIDDLYDILDASELLDIQGTITEVMQKAGAASVEVQNPKNGAATQTN